MMNGRDREEDRASYLFEQVKPELMKLLRNAPEYGLCGIDITLHQGEVTKLTVKAEVIRKVIPQKGGRP
jgi:hypothetical protein